MWGKEEWPETPTISGQLMKLTRSKYSTGAKWQPRWFAVEEESSCLYYGFNTSTAPKKINLKEAKVKFQEAKDSSDSDILTLVYGTTSLSISSPHDTVISVWYQRVMTAKSESVPTHVDSPLPPVVNPDWSDVTHAQIHTYQSATQEYEEEKEEPQEKEACMQVQEETEEWEPVEYVNEPTKVPEPPTFILASDSDEEAEFYVAAPSGDDESATSSIFSCFGMDTSSLNDYNRPKLKEEETIEETSSVNSNGMKVSFRVKKSMPPEKQEEDSFTQFFGTFNPLMGW